MPFFEDGSGKFGTNQVTINSITFEVVDFNLTDGSDTQVDTDGNGEPVRQRSTDTVKEGTMTLQFDGNGETLPGKYETFTYESHGLYVSEVGEQYQMGQYARVNISVREEINAA